MKKTCVSLINLLVVVGNVGSVCLDSHAPITNLYREIFLLVAAAQQPSPYQCNKPSVGNSLTLPNSVISDEVHRLSSITINFSKYVMNLTVS